MDCNATLKAIRAICCGEDDQDIDRLIELVEALDGWITSGGFLPAAWVNR